MKKYSSSFQAASDRLQVPVSTGTDSLEKEVRSYIVSQGGSIVPSASHCGNGNYPVIHYRAPGNPALSTFVVQKRETETVDDILKRLAGNMRVKYSPNWRKNPLPAPRSA